MWFGIDTINRSLDPRAVGDKYESKNNSSYTLEYLRTEDDTFVFKTSTGVEVTLDRDTLVAYYRRWQDPYAAQKAAAIKHGFVWKDAPEEATPITRISF